MALRSSGEIPLQGFPAAWNFALMASGTRHPIRIAIMGLLSIAAIFNLFASLGYLVGGPFVAPLGGVLGGGQDDPDLLQAIGGAKVVGLALLISAFIILMGVVWIFLGRHPRVIYLVCTACLLSAVLMVLLRGFSVPGIVSLLGGGLGFVSGLRIQVADKENSADRDATKSQLAHEWLGEWLGMGALVFGLVLIVLATLVWLH